jgi:succinoglycan biosynthesis protein ExoA
MKNAPLKLESDDWITIILPIRNEGKFLNECLDGIIQQLQPDRKYEIIISDGMSTDDTREIINNFQQKNQNIFLVDNPGKIVSTGMNAALRLSRGKIIIRVDGHCIIGPDYVKHCINHLIIDGVDGVGGSMKTIGETPISKTIAVAMSSKFGVGNSAFRTETKRTKLVDSIPFPAYTRSIIEKVGLYDEELVRNQDDEYNYRIREFGGKILLAADITSKYFSRGTLAKLWKQYYQYGFYKVRVFQKHPRQMSLRQFIPPVYILSLIGSLILALTLPWGWIVLILVASIYLLANLLASIIITSTCGWQHLPLLPVCFGILHFSYGFGFLTGLVNFWNRWSDKKGKVPAFLGMEQKRW